MPIFDQGYQHWKGRLSGRAGRWLVIARQGVRGHLKSWKVRILLLLAWMPALTLVVAICLWGLFEQGTQGVLDLFKQILPPEIAADPRVYRNAMWTIAYSTFFSSELFFIMLLVMLVGPNLISGDLRLNALPLYFSRPLTRLDYFLGKLGVIAVLVASVAIAPALAAYVLGIGFSLDLSVIRDTWWLPLAAGLYGLIIVTSTGTLMLALSSLSRRSLYVGIAWVGLWIVGNTVASVLDGIHRHALHQKYWQEEYAGTVAEPPAPGPPGKRPRRRDPQFAKWEHMQERVDRAMAEAAPTNWRPLCSYTANVQRLGEAILGTDAAWVKVGEAVAAPRAIFRMFAGPGMPPGSAEGSSASDKRRLATNSYRSIRGSGPPAFWPACWDFRYGH